MRRRLLTDRIESPISPLIDVVINAFAALFIMLMIYLILTKPCSCPDDPEPLNFLKNVHPPDAIARQNYVFTFPVTGGSVLRRFELEGELPEGLKFDEYSGTIYGIPKMQQCQSKQSSKFEIMVRVSDRVSKDSRAAILTLYPGATPYAPDEPPLRICKTGGDLPRGRVDVPYEVVLGAIGGVVPYKWRIVHGTLPRGLELAEGRISGIPAESGFFEFVVDVSHTEGSFSYKNKEYSWSGGKKKTGYKLEIFEDLNHSPNLPVGRVGEPYFGFVSTNHLLYGEHVAWADVKVPGLKSYGRFLRGTPTQEGSFNLVYKVSRGTDLLTEKSGKLRILPKRPQRNIPPATFHTRVGENFRAPIPYRGMIEPVKVIHDHDYEDFEIIDDSIIGKPKETGMVNIPIEIEDALQNYSKGSVSVFVDKPLCSVKLVMPERYYFIIGRSAYFQPKVDCGEGDYEWLHKGQLPPGLFFSKQGTIGGEVIGRGEWTVDISVRDRISGTTDSRSITFVSVYPDETTPHLITPSIPNAMVGTPFDFTFSVAGGIGFPRFFFKGNLPKGLKFTETGISGTPVQAGISQFDVIVTDEVNQKDGPKRFELLVEIIDRSKPQVVSRYLPIGIPGERYDIHLAAEGGVGKYKWFFKGDIPKGLRFLDQGRIEGIVDPQERGKWTFSPIVVDETGQQAESREMINLVVEPDWPDLELDSEPLPRAVVGSSFYLPLLAVGSWGKCTWSAIGLPEGLKLKKGRIQGIPMKPGSYTIMVSAVDMKGREASTNYTLIVNPSKENRIPWTQKILNWLRDLFNIE